MADTGCENCAFRAKYDKNPRSLLGRLWKFHIAWCPGWKKYMNSLPQEKRVETARRYGMKKYM
jgi:hypothetical protein